VNKTNGNFLFQFFNSFSGPLTTAAASAAENLINLPPLPSRSADFTAPIQYTTIADYYSSNNNNNNNNNIVLCAHSIPIPLILLLILYDYDYAVSTIIYITVIIIVGCPRLTKRRGRRGSPLIKKLHLLKAPSIRDINKRT